MLHGLGEFFQGLGHAEPPVLALDDEPGFLAAGVLGIDGHEMVAVQRPGQAGLSANLLSDVAVHGRDGGQAAVRAMQPAIATRVVIHLNDLALHHGGSSILPMP